MKTTKVSVNKTADKPEGVEINVIEPEDVIEIQVLTYLLQGFVRDAKSRGTFKLELPESFSISYQREGSFLLTSGPQVPNTQGKVHTYYTPPKPLAVLAIHSRGKQLDVVYGEIGSRKPEEAAAAPEAAPAEEKKEETADSGATS